MVKRYSSRYHELGYDVKTLGWGSDEQQTYRFAQTLEGNVVLNNKIILDIGCGFGDYFRFLQNEQISPTKYLGFDLNEDLIGEARLQYEDHPNCKFNTFNVLEHTYEEPVADIAVMLGVLNLNFQDQIDNYEYSKIAVSNAFSSVNECLIVDFLSSQLDPTYKKEEFVFYHDPGEMLNWALTITANVELKHNYASIPQKEFMLFMYK